MDKNLFNRKTYKLIKKMDRLEMETFIKNLIEDQFKKGMEAGKEIENKANEKVDLLQFIQSLNIKGIGPKTKEKILQAYKEWGIANESTK